MFPTVSTRVAAVLPISVLCRMAPQCECNRPSWHGLAQRYNQIEPDPGNDGIWFMGYKVTDQMPECGTTNMRIYNQNLDRAIQSFSVPLGPGVNVSNIGFHAPPQHPGWAHDGTLGDAGYSSTPWDVHPDANFMTWNTETFATNQNANAIRWGTLYNFRFDADQAPNPTNATVGFFKTGSPMGVSRPGSGRRPNSDAVTHSYSYSPGYSTPTQRPRLLLQRQHSNGYSDSHGNSHTASESNS